MLHTTGVRPRKKIKKKTPCICACIDGGNYRRAEQAKKDK
jgi:hypothetical protein